VRVHLVSPGKWSPDGRQDPLKLRNSFLGSDQMDNLLKAHN